MQPVPEGYKPLGFAGFTDKGTYTASEVYAKNDIVHNNNTTWRCLVNGTTGIIPAEGANWTIFIASESDSSGITTTDTEGLVGPAGEKVSNQSLIDAIAEKVAKQLVTNASLTNALAGYITKEMMSSDQTDDPDKVPTSALAYAMQQSIDELNGKISKIQYSTKSVPDHTGVYGAYSNVICGHAKIGPVILLFFKGHVRGTTDIAYSAFGLSYTLPPTLKGLRLATADGAGGESQIRFVSNATSSIQIHATAEDDFCATFALLV